MIKILFQEQIMLTVNCTSVVLTKNRFKSWEYQRIIQKQGSIWHSINQYEDGTRNKIND